MPHSGGKNVKMDMLLLDVGDDGKQIYRDKIHDYEPGQDGLRTWHAATRTGSYKSDHLSRKPVPERPVLMLLSSYWLSSTLSILNVVQRSDYSRSCRVPILHRIVASAFDIRPKPSKVAKKQHKK